MKRLVIIICIIFFASKGWAETLSLKNKKLEKEEITNQEELSKLNLKQAIDFAIENNRQIKAAIATLPVAEASLIIAKYRPNPIIASNSELVKGGSLHPIQAGTQLELGRKRYWRAKVAKEQISKTELEIAKVLWEVHVQVHSAYAAVSALTDLLDLAKERKEFYRSLLAVAEDRLSAGDVAGLDVDRAKLELLTAENDLTDLEGRLKQAKVDFNHLLGRSPNLDLVLDKPEELKPKINLLEHPTLKKIVDEALNKRLEIAILEKQYGITRAQLKQAQWERLPNLFVEAGPVKPSIGTNIWGPYFGAQTELPVFNRKQGEIKQARAQLDYLQKEENRIKLNIESEIANALHYLEVREEQLKRYGEKLLGQSQDILEMIKLGYKEGKLSLTDVLNAEQKNRQVREAYLQSILNYQIAFSNLEYAVGISLDELGEKS